MITSPQEFNTENLYVDLRPVLGSQLYLNARGSTSRASSSSSGREDGGAGREVGTAHRGLDLVESSSGNLGVALSVDRRDKGYRFLCVTDTRCNLNARRLMESMGAEVLLRQPTGREGGYLAAPVEDVQDLCTSIPASCG